MLTLAISILIVNNYKNYRSMLRVLPTTMELHDLDKLVLRFTRNTDICFHVIMNSSDPILVYALVLRMVRR